MPPSPQARTMERDGHRCVRCGRPLSAYWPGYSCHHRQRRAVGPDTLDNLIMLCGSGSTSCHGWVHANPAESRDNGWIVSSYLDPALIPAQPMTHYLWGKVLLAADGTFSITE